MALVALRSALVICVTGIVGAVLALMEAILAVVVGVGSVEVEKKKKNESARVKYLENSGLCDFFHVRLHSLSRSRSRSRTLKAQVNIFELVLLSNLDKLQRTINYPATLRVTCPCHNLFMVFSHISQSPKSN
jgi:hypothetical protein